MLRDITQGKMMGKTTRGKKWLQKYKDVISKNYEELKREAELRTGAGGRRVCH